MTSGRWLSVVRRRGLALLIEDLLKDLQLEAASIKLSAPVMVLDGADSSLNEVTRARKGGSSPRMQRSRHLKILIAVAAIGRRYLDHRFAIVI